MITASGPLVAILGVTGAQGSSVAAALVASALPYRLRGLTRDTSSPAAQNLAAQGIELRSPATAEHALEDASIVFLVCPPTERANVRQRCAAGLIIAGGRLDVQVDRRLQGAADAQAARLLGVGQSERRTLPRLDTFC